MMSGLFAVLLLAVATMEWAEARSTGAPAEACQTLLPAEAQHGAPPQTTPVPYRVNLSSLPRNENGTYYYIPGMSYALTVESTDTPRQSFKGVLLQGRTMSDDSPAGTFAAGDSNLRLSFCTPPEISVTHNSGSDKMSVTTMWTAPPEGTGNLEIGFAVVRTRMVYWGGESTATIYEGEAMPTEMPTTEAGAVAMTIGGASFLFCLIGSLLTFLL